jgi:4-amino-4-deoxy-L-arabinose transferase-like glycosyltransferase
MLARAVEPRSRGSSVIRLRVAVLLLVYAVVAATSVRTKSITFDELGHLTGGVASWLAHDYRLFPQNGQLPQRWATLPLIVAGVKFPSLDQPAWRTSNLEAVGYQFLYGIGNDHDALLWRARLAMIVIAVVLGWLCYFWARCLFGERAGLVALFIYVFSPSMLAHGPLATSDVFAALMLTASVGSFWAVMHRATTVRVLASATIMGLLFVTKMSAILVVPIALTLAAIRVWYGRPFIWLRPRPQRVSGRRDLLGLAIGILLAHAVGVAIVIWACYGFRYSTFAAGSPASAQLYLGETVDTLAQGSLARPFITVARDRRLLPEGYLVGLAHVSHRSESFVGFLNGRYSVDGWWYFFPYAWLVKTPLSIIGLLVAALLLAWRRSIGAARAARTVRGVYALIPLVVLLGVYWTAAMTSSLNVGERHLLPTYPALFILAGGAAGWFGTRRRLADGAVGALLVLLAVESLAVWPHYLAYFNPLAGGPANGYRHLVDSSLDWGQDLPALRDWLRRTENRSGPDEPVFLSYFGSGDPAQYGIDARQLYSYQDWRADRPLHPLTGGIYCISATMLQSVYTKARGPWAAPYERAYQQTRAEIGRFRTAAGDPSLIAELSNHDATTWRRLADDFEQLRLSRLAAYLRRREPDDRIGYSILVFVLSDKEVKDALDGPPVELWPAIGVEGDLPQ